MGTCISIFLVCCFFLGFVTGLPTILEFLIVLVLVLYVLAAGLMVTRLFIYRKRANPVLYREEGLAERGLEAGKYQPLNDNGLFSCFASEILSEVDDKTQVKGWFASVYPILSDEEVSRVEELFDDWQR